MNDFPFFALLTVLLLLKTVSFAQPKTALDSIISNTQVIFKGETIYDVGGNSRIAPMYSRVTNNNKFYTDSTARVDSQLLYKMIQNGSDFYDLAVNYSQDPGSYKKGGELKPTFMDEYVEEYRKAILKLKIGEISLPFKSMYGYHIAQLISVKDGIYVSRHILLRLD